MKDIGKDLDRWIAEKEIEEAADLMDKIPEKGRKFIKEKLDKVKREIELYGPQAVVCKLLVVADLPLILCIELYTVENGEQRVGLYSLEMAAELELDPKQYNVIAFEDADGNAFIVTRSLKGAFQEAKANGFSVTVIRKGQLQLNVD
ncbi:embryo defective [Olea europaea subsp. europaea]|uniref:Embryo defective n=1 Tax=Olea europaea subsp. europaea TaxID=158383 RepID=A0A8S0QA59_OLEEU|nr:embryo defective [Olea europaea subsp. europaea]